ncbi:MAG: hypothetical protein ACI4HO_01620 [Ruminococcus sp.]
MKKNSYISAMDKTALNDKQKDKLKDLYNAVNNPTEEKIMSIEKKRIRRKPLAVLAASLALLIGFGTFSLVLPNKSNNENSFVLKVNAAELKEGKAVLADTSAFGFAVSEGDDNLDYYSIDFPVKYEGDNIKSVTYSINKGCFELYRFSDSNEKKSSKDQELDTKAENEENIEYSIPDECDGISNSEYAKVDSSYDKTKKFTVGYDDQKNSERYIYITGDSKHLTTNESDEVKKAFYGDVAIEKEKAAFDKLLGNLIITSTINFNDGTTKTQNIKIGTKIVDYKEATTDEIPPEKRGSTLSFTFEIV